jgi:hypothetical protein
MNTEEDYDEFTAALNAAMTTPPYAATPDEIEALAAEEFHVRNGVRWETASDQARAEALQWASMTLIAPAVQNILRSAQAKAVQEAAEDVYGEWPENNKVEKPNWIAETWLYDRADQIRKGRR